MADRTLPPPPDPFAEVKARFGQENLEAILETYRQFADKVDYRALMTWTIKRPLEELLQPLFLAALVVITKGLRLGELAKQLDGPFEGGETEWAVRFDGVRVTRYLDMPNEEDARSCAASTSPENANRYTVVRRLIGPWTDA